VSGPDPGGIPLLVGEGNVVEGQGEAIHLCLKQGTPASSPCLKDRGYPQAGF